MTEQPRAAGISWIAGAEWDGDAEVRSFGMLKRERVQETEESVSDGEGLEPERDSVPQSGGDLRSILAWG